MPLTAGLVASPVMTRDLDGCMPELFEAVRRRRARRRQPPSEAPES